MDEPTNLSPALGLTALPPRSSLADPEKCDDYVVTSSINPATHPAVVVSRSTFLLIMLSIWLGNFAAYFNEITATTAMHIIAADFDDSRNQNWIATAYLLAFAVSQTLLGSFSDIFGRGQIFNSTMLIFAAGTLWGGLAQSMPSLIGARILQGIGAAGRQTVGVIVIIDLTTTETCGLWLGFYNLSCTLGLSVGPLLGAVIPLDVGWRWLFWIDLIIICISFGLGVKFMHYPVPHRKQSNGLLSRLKEVDYAGAVLAVAISSLICIAVEMGNKEFPWSSAPIIAMFVIGGGLIPVFVFYESKVPENPILDMSLFKIHNVRIGCLINFLTGASYFGGAFFLPRYFLDIRGSGLVAAGVQMLGFTISTTVASASGANIVSKTGQVRIMGLIGGTLYALGSGLMLTVSKTSPISKIIGFSIMMGYGAGTLYQPSLIVGPKSVLPRQQAGISAFLSFLRTFGGTFGTALLTAVYETTFTRNLRGRVPEDLLSQGLGLADNHDNYPQYSTVIVDALVDAFHVGSVPAIVFGVVYAVAVVMLRNIDSVPSWRKRHSEAARKTDASSDVSIVMATALCPNT